MNDVFGFWGSGKGLLKMLQPDVRILSGVLVSGLCMITPLASIPGVGLLVAASLCWCWYAAMPARMLLRCTIAAVVLFGPFLLLTPWMTMDSTGPASLPERAAHAGGIALRSASCLFVAASTIAALSLQDVHRGLARLPIPRSMVMLITQLINQTMLLTEETTRIVGVLRLRGTSGRNGVRVMLSFPIVWMVRMLFRAERSAAAMTIRGYGIEVAAPTEKANLTIADTITVMSVSAGLMASVLMRLGVVA